MPLSGFELATQWSEAQHATAGLRRPPTALMKILFFSSTIKVFFNEHNLYCKLSHSQGILFSSSIFQLLLLMTPPWWSLLYNLLLVTPLYDGHYNLLVTPLYMMVIIIYSWHLYMMVIIIYSWHLHDGHYYIIYYSWHLHMMVL